MKTADEYKKITSDKYIQSIIKFEDTHTDVFSMIEKKIKEAALEGQYAINITMWSLSGRDIKMLTYTLRYYGFTVNWLPEPDYNTEERKQYTLTIHWV